MIHEIFAEVFREIRVSSDLRVGELAGAVELPSYLDRSTADLGPLASPTQRLSAG